MKSNEFYIEDSVRYDRFGAQTQQRLGTRIMQVDQNFRAELLELVEAGDVPVEFPNVLNLITLLPAGSNANSHSHSNPNTDIFYYHTNHLGSTAFVTDANATVTQGFLYAPFGEITTEFNARFGNGIIPKYTFNAKELDEETGMYYYEARYYNPPVFVSRDAMFEKYFWMSPYGYCSNNPLKYVDPTGMDFDPVIDEENKTITIKATYYTSKENEAELQKALDVWNKQSGIYSYVVGKGKNKQKYTINFDLTIADGNFETNSDAGRAYDRDESGKANFYGGRIYVGKDRGITSNGSFIRLNKNEALKSDIDRTLSHEVGHTLGLTEWTSGLMESGGNNTWISRDYVSQILATAGFSIYIPLISAGRCTSIPSDGHERLWTGKRELMKNAPSHLQNGKIKTLWP